ncbi:Eukaryotic aspartyl protease family protein [Striga hermonthica]|uniref:Eukaryotic aspartyl protease family protein n=1 Tax=Striga hermonthica TaxID=68872 RepID=A0A9N7MTT6_STRHE|nr:Eukaryotic aspartyl protease family protein [Striga hermonthica]
MLFSSSSNGSRASEIQFQTLDITSQLSATVCSPVIHPGLKNRKSSAVLELIHRHGPCAVMNQTKPISRPSTTHILRNDKLRVESIFNGGRIPVSSGDSLQNTGEYIVTMGLGTPETKLSLLFDTGSELTWTQCKPGLLGYHSQKDPMFDPHKSTSYSFIPCNSSECSLLATDTTFGPDCSSANQCTYVFTYGDGSITVGYFSKDTLTITPNVKVPNFMFGCGQFTQGLFGLEAGILGLGRTNISIVSQTANIFQECFSYCIPSNPSSNGFLAFGKDYDNTTKFTPLILKQEYSPVFYYIHITDIAVDGRKLRISPENDVKLDLDASGTGTLWVYNKSLMCLAFASTDDTVGLLGNTQQKTFEVVYDVAGQKLGFTSGMCT